MVSLLVYLSIGVIVSGVLFICADNENDPPYVIGSAFCLLAIVWPIVFLDYFGVLIKWLSRKK